MTMVTSEETFDAYRRPQKTQAAADAIPLLVNGTYHLFHLTTPPGTVHHPPRLRSCWSRLRSDDLIHWVRDPEPIVAPGENPSDPDTSGAWTGSAVLGPDGRMNIFYTGYCLPQNGKQVVLRITADDEHGSHFDLESRRQIVIKENMHHSQYEDIDFRDPFIFANEGIYWMLVATRFREGPYWTRGCIALLTSSDLLEWSVEPQPLYAPGDMFCPECPELFQLGSKWYLVYSRFAAPNTGTVYRVADSPRGPFRTPRDGSHGRLDGRRWYAAKSCPKAGDPDKRIFFGWIADKCEDDGRWLWGGDLGIPREIFADDQGHLRVQPVAEVLKAMERNSSLSPGSVIRLSSIGSTSTSFPPQMDVANTSEYIHMNLTIMKVEAASFGLVFGADSDLRGYRLQLIPTGKLYTVLLLTDMIPLDDFWADQYKLYIPRGVDGPELLRHDGVELDGQVSVLLHGPLLEVFVGGRSISYRLPLAHVDKEQSAGPLPDRNHRVGLFVEDGDVEMSLRIEPLKVRSKEEIMKTLIPSKSDSRIHVITS